MKTSECPYCKNKMSIAKYHCDSCNTGIEGEFYSNPVTRLSESHQKFIELFVLSSGSLKEMARLLGKTYPTVRARLNEVIFSLKNEIASKEDYKDEILKQVESKELTAEAAAQILKSL